VRPKGRRMSILAPSKEHGDSDDVSESGFMGMPQGSNPADLQDGETSTESKIVLPTGPAFYNATVWLSEDMQTIRQRYSDGIFFQKFNSGLRWFYRKDWDDARPCFSTNLARFEDGPSWYF
jgi:hypothetical protein